MNAAPEATMRAQARSLRGPWWWRLRCWTAQKMLNIGCALDPEDRSSISWYSDDHQTLHIVQIRRRP